jgi:hypothetical protein
MPSSQAVPVGQGSEVAVSHVGTQRPLAHVSAVVQSVFATHTTQRCRDRLQCGCALPAQCVSLTHWTQVFDPSTSQ